MRLDHQLYVLPGQFIRDFKTLALPGNGAIPADLARQSVAEEFVQLCGAMAQGFDPGEILLIALQWCLSPQGTVWTSMIKGLKPCPKPCIEIGQIRNA